MSKEQEHNALPWRRGTYTCTVLDYLLRSTEEAQAGDYTDLHLKQNNAKYWVKRRLKWWYCAITLTYLQYITVNQLTPQPPQPLSQYSTNRVRDE